MGRREECPAKTRSDIGKFRRDRGNFFYILAGSFGAPVNAPRNSLRAIANPVAISSRARPEHAAASGNNVFRPRGITGADSNHPFYGARKFLRSLRDLLPTCATAAAVATTDRRSGEAAASKSFAISPPTRASRRISRTWSSRFSCARSRRDRCSR